MSYLQDLGVSVADAFADLRSKVDGDCSHGREVLPQLPDAEACRAWLQKLVSKPDVVLRHARSLAPLRMTLPQEGGSALSLEPVAVLTWTVNQKIRPLSAQAPADSRVWSVDDNFAAVRAEVLRLQPDLLTLQECASATAAPRFAEKYTFVGARAGHSEAAGFVHLYVKKSFRHLPLEVDGLPGIGCRVKMLHTFVAVVALHLSAGEEAAVTREKHLRRVVDLTDATEDTVVLLGDLNVRDSELAELTRRPLGAFGATRVLPMHEAVYSGNSWFPQANRYSDEDGYAKRQPQRFDRVLVTGDAFGYSYVVGRRQHFAGGRNFSPTRLQPLGFLLFY